MSSQLLDAIRVDVLKRLQILTNDMSPDRLEDFLRAASQFPESYHIGIVELILKQAANLTNSEADFKRKMRHYYVIEYLHRHKTFQALVRKTLSWFLVEEIEHAKVAPTQLGSLMELMCAFEPNYPNEINSCLKQAYERTGEMVTSVG